ncbi:hypothetical protein V5279_33255 [Bradyrhizobium sp. 26S5]|uniref:hypothetical protein n=1 Tax=Bradyrhizobium sp. 26S5 TaxID=3139729 RepID=UPI0030CF2D41
MSISFMESVSSPVRRHISILLLRIRRIVNQLVAGMLANRERQVSGLMPREPGDRCSRPIIRSGLLGLVIAGLSSPVFTRAEEPVVREHRAAPVQQAVVWPQRSKHGCNHRSDWSIVAASTIPVFLDRRT